MNRDARYSVFITSTPADFNAHPPTVDIPARQQELVEEEDGSVRRLGGQIATPAGVMTEFQTVQRVLNVLEEGGMDVVGFLDALSWGNSLAITDPTTKQARTNLMHSNQLATVVSRWLSPPRTSQGGRGRKARDKFSCRSSSTR